jgi:hypothetical protein
MIDVIEEIMARLHKGSKLMKGPSRMVRLAG